MLEEWRSIPGCEPFEVSDQGRVRKGERILPLYFNECGYPYVSMRIPALRKPKRGKIHRLVMEAFVGPLPPGMVTRHLDGDQTNGRLANLCYGTPSQNTLDLVAHGRHNQARKTHCKNGHEFTPENTRTRRDGGRSCIACGIGRYVRVADRSIEQVAS